MASIRLENVVKRFESIEIIHGVDLNFEHGEFVVFVGPSGCGKSTLLRLISGLEDMSGGDMYFDDQLMNHVDPTDRGVAMVFQSYALYPHMSVEENMSFGLRMNKAEPQYIAERVAKAAEILKLQPLLQRKPKELSGGQRQRVAIGRAIVRDPKVFLFDEPLSNLDAELRVDMRVQIAELHQKLDATMIYVTHDQVEAMTLADKIVVLKDRGVEQVGSPLHLYHHPANEFVAGFMGSPKMNFISANVTNLAEKQVQIELPDGQKVWINTVHNNIAINEKVKLGIRPEHIVKRGEGDLDLQINVTVAEHLGGVSYLYGEYEGISGFTVEVQGSNRTKAKELVSLGIKLNMSHLFDSNGIVATASTEAAEQEGLKKVG